MKKKYFLTTFACAVLLSPPSLVFSSEIKIAGSTTIQPFIKEIQIKMRGKFKDNELTLSGGGSRLGVACVKEKTCDIGMSSKAPSAEESKNLKVVQIGYDGLAFVVNKENSFNNITDEQAKNLFSNKVTKWAEFKVNGLKDPITVITRSKESGETDLFKAYFKLEPLGTAIISSNSDVVLSIAKDNGAIAFMSYGVAEKNKSKGLKILNFDGMEPNTKSISDGSYKLKRGLYLIYNPLAQNASDLKIFIDEALKERKDLFQNYGFIEAN